MVVCKFFLQGTCRFGQSCKFDHQLTGIADGNQVHSSVLRPQTMPESGTGIDINTLTTSVVNDMLSAEKGGQWLLSSYAPFKEKPNFPGFEDQSFEEIRHGFFKAQKNGSLVQFKHQLQLALQDVASKVRALQNPTPYLTDLIRSIYLSNTVGSEASNAFVNSTSTFNTNLSEIPNPIFGGNMNTNNMFRNTNQSLFNQSRPVNANATSIFATANKQMFANTTSQQNPFLGNTQPSNNFINQQQTSPMNAVSPFATQQPNNSSPFTMQPQNTSPFATQQPTAALSLETQVQPQGSFPFGGTQSGQFGPQAPPTSSVFSQQTTNPNMFQQPLHGTNNSLLAPQNTMPSFSMMQQTYASNNTATAHTSSIFGGMQGQTAQGNNASSNTKITLSEINNLKNRKVFSKLENLSESDIKAYESDSFEFGNIPERPPTFEICFGPMQ